MPTISPQAHFDGTAIRLDEPYELPRDAKLLITVLTPASGDAQLAGWTELEQFTKYHGRISSRKPLREQ